MIRSMTAYASRRGALGAQGWLWEMRGVNGRGLDLRLRLPEGIDGLEPAVRAALSSRLARGNVSLSLRLNREESAPLLTIDPTQLAAALDALAQVQTAARDAGLALSPPGAAEILSLRGVAVQATATVEEGLLPALLADLDGLIADFIAMRALEGAALAKVLTGQLDRIATLVAEAGAMALARQDETRASLRAALRRVLDDMPEIDETRIAQELALIAVKQDVAEELARLTAHIEAARALLAGQEPSGRKLDFLAQEFNREANTLCSKAQSAALTRLGLDLKATIDQMREQVQNVE